MVSPKQAQKALFLVFVLVITSTNPFLMAFWCLFWCKAATPPHHMPEAMRSGWAIGIAPGPGVGRLRLPGHGLTGTYSSLTFSSFNSLFAHLDLYGHSGRKITPARYFIESFGEDRKVLDAIEAPMPQGSDIPWWQPPVAVSQPPSSPQPARSLLSCYNST